MDLTATIAAVAGAIPVAGDSLVAVWRTLSQQVATLAVTALWQGAVIACGLTICFRLAPRTSASHRFAAWSAAFITIVSLPLLGLFSNLQGNVVRGVSRYAARAADRPWLSLDAGWSLVIAGLWAAVMLWRGADLAVHSLRLRKLWKDAIPVELDGRLNAMVAEVAAAWGRGPVEVCTTTRVQRPCVIGFLRPRILIPDWLFARLTAGELEQIVLHEAEHLRRYDDWTNLLQKISLVLFPLNPALIWIERRLCREREMACDDGVVRITRAPRAYAACLARLADRGLERRAAEALSLGAWQRRPELVHRVHSILRGKHGLGPVANRVLLGTLGCVLLVGAAELARCPQLIAFVPARNSEVAQIAARPVLGGYEPLQLAGLQKAAVVSARRASRAKGTVKMAEANGSFASSGVVQSDAVEREIASAAPEDQSLRAIPLKAEMDGSHVAPMGRQYEEQEWVVLTAWEQVQTWSANSQVRADYDTSANAGGEMNSAANSGTTATANATRKTNAQPDGQPANRITVTRLIFRVMPAGAVSNSTSISNSKSAQPGVAAMSGGWLVFQL